MLETRLLDEAQAAHQRLQEAQRQELLAKAEYHTAVRRLHAAGGSLREIGQALGLSHQRIQQIVDRAGGSWWGRVWRTRGARRDAVCTFCERPPSEVAQLIAGPDVYICDACVSLGETAVREPGADGKKVIAAPRRARCSFCGKPGAVDRPVVQGGEGRICLACLGLCRDILDRAGSAN